MHAEAGGRGRTAEPVSVAQAATGAGLMPGQQALRGEAEVLDSHALRVRAERLHALVRRRDDCFMRPVMADVSMSVMLSLFLAELRGVPITEATLALVNLLEGEEGRRIVPALVGAGLAAATGDAGDRRLISLTPLGSSRMRSFITDYPDI